MLYSSEAKPLLQLSQYRLGAEGAQRWTGCPRGFWLRLSRCVLSGNACSADRQRTLIEVCGSWPGSALQALPFGQPSWAGKQLGLYRRMPCFLSAASSTRKAGRRDACPWLARRAGVGAFGFAEAKPTWSRSSLSKAFTLIALRASPIDVGAQHTSWRRFPALAMTSGTLGLANYLWMLLLFTTDVMAYVG